MATDPPARGMFGSVRRLAETGLGLLQNRVELFAVELRLEKARQVRTFLWTALAVFSGAMAAVLVTVTLLAVFWETARIPALIAASAFYCIICIGACAVLRTRLASPQMPFADTLSELRKDREWMQSSNSEDSKTGNGP